MFKPRPYQQELMEAMRTKKRAIGVFHRRAGKDYLGFHLMLERALAEPGQYYYVFPTYTQARKALWDLRDNEGKTLRDLIPSWALRSMNANEMKILLKSGSLIQLVGAENPDSLRGTNPKGIIFSEYAMCEPDIWHAVAKPILAQNGGWALFITTPMGRNHFFDLYEQAKTNPEWYVSLKTIEDTGVVPLAVIEQDREEGMSEDLIGQEYRCSFTSGSDGLLYQAQIEKARETGRIGSVSADHAVPVHTAWDLGISDSTAIIAFQVVQTEVHIVNYLEANGKELGWYIERLRDWGYTYGKHFAPHDVEARSLQTGLSLKQQAAKLGLPLVTLPMTGLQSGIQLTRATLSKCWFDEERCKFLLKALSKYTKSWDPRRKVWSDQPRHDESSHGSDAMRYLAQAVPLLRGATGRSGSDVMREAFQAGHHGPMIK